MVGNREGLIMFGRPLAEALEAENAARSSRLAQRGKVPKLAVVRVGEGQDDVHYENSIVKKAPKSGVEVVRATLRAGCSQSELEDEIRKLSQDPEINGIIMMRPLPRGLDEKAAIQLISPGKDVDGATDVSMEAVYADKPGFFVPCTAQAAVMMLKFYGVELKGARAAVVGRSFTVGKPAAMLLLKENATVTICHSRTKDLEGVLSQCDVVIATAGKPRIVGPGCIKPGASIVDVGYNVLPDGTVCGDVDFEAAKAKGCRITPVPKGLGSATVTVLMRHVIEAAEEAAGILND
ncbi:MAG: bifunctional 5,10-methylenetetrahydrofolate dehydrogenase/5,10-methenyltetrahydrofolate cyclohydrolase [Oscillospiraceae bacterium]|jgi:methylenetetrahydrofolate dehydrogenase (NADP+)/methenyltetrahydrofolate cyclohydrolase